MLRLQVELRDGVWSVLGGTVVDGMTVTASAPEPAGGRHTGLWFEVLDRRGDVLYRSVLTEPLPGVEVHRRDGSITRATAELRRWGTELLVPVLRAGTRLRLHHVPGAGAQPALKPVDAATGLVLDVGVDDVAAEG